MDGIRAKIPGHFQLFIDFVDYEDRFEAETSQHYDQGQADCPCPDDCQDCVLGRTHQVNRVKSDCERLGKKTNRRIDLRLESKSLALVTGEEVCHRAPVTGIDPENPLVGTDMFRSSQAMAAHPASQGRKNGDTISGTKRRDFGTCLHHGAGHLMPHHHARFAPTAFPRKAMDIAPADADRIGTD